MLEKAPVVQAGSVCLGFYGALTLAGPTVNGSALLPHGPRPKLRTCPNNKDGNMEEVSNNQIPATERNGCGIIMPAQLYNVTLNFSRAEICSDVLEEFPLLS